MLLNIMNEFSNMIGEDLIFWTIFVIAAKAALGLTDIKYRTPEVRSKQTKDKDGNIITEYVRLERK